MSKPNGVILYQGPSLLDGSPIVAIAIGLATKSTNSKTGAMLQTYILRSDVSPLDAVRTGRDAGICGDCRHRGDGTGKGRTCYVQVGQGPQGVYKAFKRGRYPLWSTQASSLPLIGLDRIVRLGTYGDPAAVPVSIWSSLTSGAKGHTGYTHQWRTAPGLQKLCMASVDSEEEAIEAWSLGWRTFRVAMTNRNTQATVEAWAMSDPDRRVESLCPASKEAGKKLTCAQCLACGGADGRKGSIYIPAHGGFAVMANVSKLSRIPIRTE